MYSGDITIELAGWVMTQRMTEAHIAADNIRNANTPGARPMGTDFEASLASIRDALAGGDLETVSLLMSRAPRITNANQASIAIDREVADLVSAQGGYKVIAKAISLKLGLMTLAANGGRQ